LRQFCFLSILTEHFKVQFPDYFKEELDAGHNINRPAKKAIANLARIYAICAKLALEKKE